MRVGILIFLTLTSLNLYAEDKCKDPLSIAYVKQGTNFVYTLSTPDRILELGGRGEKLPSFIDKEVIKRSLFTCASELLKCLSLAKDQGDFSVEFMLSGEKVNMGEITAIGPDISKSSACLFNLISQHNFPNLSKKKIKVEIPIKVRLKNTK